jgi:carbon-monoxide dehydrogenase large subunit
MNDQIPTSAQRAEALQGMGCKRKRVEDVRFVQGKGNYVDDLKLPGMLYGDFMRSPHAHARIKKIGTAKAAAVPGVVAVLTAETLKTVNLAWMPTLAGDVQMVLADGKVLFQNQEVAFVIAEERYVAADAADLVEVEYEALPVNVDPLKAMAQDAPVIREDIKDKTEGAHGKRKPLQPCLQLAGRRQGGDRSGIRQRRSDDQGIHRLSARASVPARDLSVRCIV